MTSLTAFLIVCQLGATTDPFPRTLKAILLVESGGDPNAVGDGGRAIGPYQIHRAYWSDATRLLGVSWPYSDARDPLKAAAAVRAYTEHYARHYRKPWTAETIARIHVGGPRGPFRKSSIPYWKKVKYFLDNHPERK